MMNVSKKQLPFFSINCNGKLLDLTSPKIMGILNLTPDSFSDGGRYNTEHKALLHTEKMISEGADIIDLGAQSTKPNAIKISSKEERLRLGNMIALIKKNFPETLVSLDTFYADVVNFGYNEGIDIINDVSGGQYDETMFLTAAKTQLPYVLMHTNAHYNEMHLKQNHDKITVNLNQYFSEKIQELYNFGVKDIILDPGFGFGKTQEDQIQLLEEIHNIGFGKFPILIGISRKSFIYKPLGKTPLDIEAETQKLHLKVLEQGAKILRVHQVKETKKTISDFLENQ